MGRNAIKTKQNCIRSKLGVKGARSFYPLTPNFERDGCKMVASKGLEGYRARMIVKGLSASGP